MKTVTIKKISTLAREFKLKDPFGKDYGKLLEKLFEQLDRPFYNYRVGKMTSEYLRLNAKTVEQVKFLEAKDKKTTVTLEVDLGEKYKGKSPLWVKENLPKEELLLPAAYVAQILQDKSILSTYKETWIDCAADEHSWDADGRWALSCYFGFHDSKLKFYAYDAGRSDGHCGTAVAEVSGSVTLKSFPVALSPFDALDGEIITIRGKKYELKEVE